MAVRLRARGAPLRYCCATAGATLAVSGARPHRCAAKEACSCLRLDWFELLRPAPEARTKSGLG